MGTVHRPSPIKISAGIAVTALALWLSLRKTDWPSFKASILRADAFWVIVAAACSLFAVVVLGWRWQILLRPKAKISQASLFRLNIIAQCVNIVAPGRFGEITKAYLASRQSSVSGAFALGTVAVEKFLDFTVFVILWIIVPPLFGRQELFRAYPLILAAGIAALTAVGLLAVRPESALRLAKRLIPLLPARFGERALRVAESGVEAFAGLRGAGNLFSLGGLTFLVLAGEIVPIYLLFRSLGLDLPVTAALFVLIMSQAGKIPPSLPGKVGVYEYMAILALAVFGVPKDQALSLGIILHVITFVPRIALGMIFLVGLKSKRNQSIQSI